MDFNLTHKGANTLIEPETPRAWRWAQRNLPPDTSRVGSSYAIDHVKAYEVVIAIECANLTIATV